MQELPDTPTKIIRELIYQNWDATEVNQFDVTVTDPTDSAFIPLSDDWNAFGDVYPSIYITNPSATVVGGGRSGYTGLNGATGALNKEMDYSCLVTVQAEDETDYNGEDGKEMLRLLSNHIQNIIQDNGDGNATDSLGNPINFGSPDLDAYSFDIDGGERTPDTESDVTLFQKQHTAGFSVNREG